MRGAGNHARTTGTNPDGLGRPGLVAVPEDPPKVRLILCLVGSQEPSRREAPGAMNLHSRRGVSDGCKGSAPVLCPRGYSGSEGRPSVGARPP